MMLRKCIFFDYEDEDDDEDDLRKTDITTPETWSLVAFVSGFSFQVSES
jgi:hypothetical protein